MEIEGFDWILSIVTLAKELHDIGRYDIIQQNLYDTLDIECYYENVFGVISSVFSEYYSCYIEEEDTDCMIFMDDVISGYFVMAWEYGRTNKIPHEKNPYVKMAAEEVQKWLYFDYSLDWKFLGYTKSKSAAKKSKLIVYTYSCEFNEIDELAYRLLMIYKWFSGKCAEFAKEAMAA